MRATLRLLGRLRPYWRITAAAYACMLVNASLELVVPALLGWVVDRGIGQADLDFLAWAAIAVVALTALRGLFAFGQTYLVEAAAQNVARDLRADIYRQLQRLSFAYHDRAQTGQLMSRATADVELIRNFTGRSFLLLIHVTLLFLGVGIVLFLMHWQLALVSLLMAPLLVRSLINLTSAIRPRFVAVQQELAELSAVIQENLAGVRVVKSFGREPEEVHKFDRQNDRLMDRYLAAMQLVAGSTPQVDFIAGLGTAAVLWFGGTLVIQGQLTLGELVAFNSYLLLLVRPVRRLGNFISQASRAGAAGTRIFEIVDTQPDIADRPGATELGRLLGDVRFEHVSLRYFTGEAALQDISFHGRPGQVVALMGPTGAGKTTVMNLIPRFYDVSEGRVLVDGQDVRDVTLSSLRRQIGVVMQESVLFSGTIRENIVFGRPTATQSEIEAAAKAAQAHDFIREMPQAYETLVGERGVTLSGGQRQRIAIARALLADPRILLLDDFTSGLDLETERSLRIALENLMQGRTTFIVAQRVATVLSADLILVIDQGQLVASGQHEQLLAECGLYGDLYELQLSSALGDPRLLAEALR